MSNNKLTDEEKRKIIQDVLGKDSNAVGKDFPMFSALADYLSTTNDVLSFAELVPSFNSLLSGAVTSTIVSTASFIGVLLFPFIQLINIINAYQIGHRMYSYRCVAYTITSWAFDKPKVPGSARILSNINSGPIQKRQSATKEYNKLWQETSLKVLNNLNVTSAQKKIPTSHLKAIFRALSGNQADKLCESILIHFEKNFDSNTRNIWKSNYKIRYPQ